VSITILGLNNQIEHRALLAKDEIAFSLPHKEKQFHLWPTAPDALFDCLNRELFRWDKLSGL